MRTQSVALLPTQTNVNPANPVNEYVDANTGLIVLENDLGKRTVVSNHGAGFDEQVGDKFEAHHDQQGYTFRTLTVVGLVHVEVNGERLTEGEVPNRKLALRVFK